MLYGYARASSDQKIEYQIIALKSAGVEEKNIFIDKQLEQESYQKLATIIERGDIIILKSMDQLGHNNAEILKQWNTIIKIKGADIKVLDIPLLDTSYRKDILGTFISDLVFQILSFQIEQERTYVKQRQAEGIAAAKSRGVKFGRPRKALPRNFEELYQRYLKNEPITKLAKECKDISESTLRLRIYERLKQGKSN